jgi:hypothetical protein
MVGGIVDQPNPLQALLAAAGVLAGSGALRLVIPPFWTAYPTLGSQRAGGRAEAYTMPLLRSDIAFHLHSAAVPGWLLAFLQRDGADAGHWVLKRNSAHPFGGRSPLDYMVTHGMRGLAETLKFLNRRALERSKRLLTPGRGELRPGYQFVY